MTKSQVEENPTVPLQRKHVCKYTNPETGRPCGQGFNERANLKVSCLSIWAWYRFTSEECILTRNLTHAHSALKGFLWSVTEMTTCGDTQGSSPTSAPYPAATTPTSASTSWWAMAGPKNIVTFLLVSLVSWSKTCRPQIFLLQTKLLSPKCTLFRRGK